MATNVNVTVSSESDGTTRDNVPDFRLTFDVSWIDEAGDPQSRSEVEYFLLLLNWLRVNHPPVATRMMRRVGFEIARAKYGMDAGRLD